jgi:hypothetical protein
MNPASPTTLRLAILLTAIGVSCANRDPIPTPANPPGSSAAGGSARVSGTSAAATDPNSVPSIAQREVIRRQEMVRRMDDAALRASQRMAEDDLEGAVEGYRKAMDGR